MSISYHINTFLLPFYMDEYIKDVMYDNIKMECFFCPVGSCNKDRGYNVMIQLC